MALRLAAAAAALGPAAPAAANGRFPGVSTVTAREGEPDFLLVGATYGMVLTNDATATWGWVCEQAIGYMGTLDPVFVRGAAGTLLATTFEGITRSVDGGCTWDPVAGTAGELFRAMIAHPTLPGTYLATSGGGAVDFGALYVSGDDGQTWTASATLQSAAQYYEGVAVSPVDPTRWYVVSWYFTPREAFVHVSDDAGATWADLPVPVVDPESARLLGVSATDPDVVLWLVDGVNDSVHRSVDGGVTEDVASALALSTPLAAFTVGGDGTMYYATLVGELFRSTDDGATWAPAGAAPPPLTYLSESAGKLYACTNPFVSGFSVGVSADQGATFGPVYTLTDTDGPLACPTGTPAATLCGPLWPSIAVELGIKPSQDAGKGGTDAGTGGGGPCGGCTVSGAGGLEPSGAALTPPLLLLLFVPLVAARALRRGRRAGTAAPRRD
ncbi:MAG TPA: sialidase family protein [Myxococcota bacterium]|nr:sialidase family protein [Myxococcota bacterium]